MNFRLPMLVAIGFLAGLQAGYHKGNDIASKCALCFAIKPGKVSSPWHSRAPLVPAARLLWGAADVTRGHWTARTTQPLTPGGHGEIPHRSTLLPLLMCYPFGKNSRGHQEELSCGVRDDESSSRFSAAAS